MSKGSRQRIRVNEEIRCYEVRVIGFDGQVGVKKIDDALSMASDEGLDLVEVDPNAKPPVCKIMNFGKFKYEEKKKANIAKKKQKVVELKEVKMRPKTDEHDFRFKLNHVRRFLGDGNKAKVTVRFRGRENAHPEVAVRLLGRVVEEIGDIAVVEQGNKMEGRAMTIVLAPC